VYDLAAVERFLTTDTDVAYGHTSSINEEALKEAYENVRSQHAPPVVSGTDLLSQIESTLRIIPFGCKSIDDMLEGGFREGQVSEIYGDSGIYQGTKKKKNRDRLWFYILFSCCYCYTPPWKISDLSFMYL
jgi:hypothetical protein